MDPERFRPAPAPTGDPRVDAAIEGLASLEDTELADRPAVLEEVHDRLREILGELGDPGGAAAAGPARPGEPGRRGEQGELGGSAAPGVLRPGQQPPRPGPPGSRPPGSWPRRP